MRRATFTIAISLLLGGLASNAGAAGAPAPAALHMSSCQLGLQSVDRQASFYARMRAVSGTARMAMRFTLIERFPGEAPAVVGSPALATWRQSRPGVQNFGYTQTVNGLAPGSAYRMAVEFRWYDAQGRLLRRGWRSSGDCRELGPLAGLKIADVSAVAGAEANTTVYGIRLLNSGSTVERATTAAIFVDGVAGDSQQLDTLQPGRATRLDLRGPSCLHRIRVVVERFGAYRQATVLSARCPAVK